MLNNEPKIIVSDLNVFYGNKQAIFDINMSINSKEVTAFIGPSGCGKSTLLRCFNRMNDLIDICKITGNIKLDDLEVYSKKIEGLVLALMTLPTIILSLIHISEPTRP